MPNVLAFPGAVSYGTLRGKSRNWEEAVEHLGKCRAETERQPEVQVQEEEHEEPRPRHVTVSARMREWKPIQRQRERERERRGSNLTMSCYVAAFWCACPLLLRISVILNQSFNGRVVGALHQIAHGSLRQVNWLANKVLSCPALSMCTQFTSQL